MVPKHKSRIAVAVCSAAAVGLLSSRTFATSFTWSGLGSDAFLTDQQNWVGNNAPNTGGGSAGSSDDASFTGTLNTTPLAASTLQYFGFTFLAGAAPFTIDNGGVTSNTLIFGTSSKTGGNIVNLSQNLQTINNTVAMRVGTINASAGPLLFTGGLIPGNNALSDGFNNFVDGPFNTTLAGLISNSNPIRASEIPGSIYGRITKNGTGTLLITASNTFPGSVFINNGAVQISNASSLGASTLNTNNAGFTQITSAGSGVAGGTDNGVLQLVNNISVAEPLTLNGRDTNPLPAHIENVSDNNTLSGAITLAAGGSNYALQSDAGSLTITSTITLSANTSNHSLQLDGAGVGTLASTVKFAGESATGHLSVYKTGTGVWSVATTSNTYTGGTVAGGGALVYTGYAPNTFTSAIPGGKLYLNGTTANSNTYGGRVVVQGDSANAASYVSALATSYSGGSWTGSGAITGAAALQLPGTAQPVIGATSSNLMGVGYMTGSDYLLLHGAGDFNPGYTVQPTDMLLRFTYMGDATLDGKITVSDYAQIDATFLLGGAATWLDGDFNYDGVVDYQDYAIIDAAYLAQSGALLADGEIDHHAAEFGAPYLAALHADMGPAAVPEPASVGLLAAGAMGLLVRRKTRAIAR